MSVQSMLTPSCQSPAEETPALFFPAKQTPPPPPPLPPPPPPTPLSWRVWSFYKKRRIHHGDLDLEHSNPIFSRSDKNQSKNEQAY